MEMEAGGQTKGMNGGRRRRRWEEKGNPKEV